MTQSGLGDQAWLLDQAGLPAEPGADVAAATTNAARMRELLGSAFPAEEVADGLSLNASGVRRLRRDRALWAINAGRSWLFPRSQFEIEHGLPLRQISGLDRVLQALPATLHPLAVDRFLHTCQPDLYLHEPMTALEWLRAEGDVGLAVDVAVRANWYG
jgi:hypothetical protein